MKAILLAGGLGTRLRPITLACPKPLLPIGNVPLIQRIVLNLRAQDIKEFVFLLHYQPEKIMQALGDGKAFDASFQYVIMEKDLSTAGSVKFACDHIKQTTLIYSADILAEIPLREMLAFHQRRRAVVTLALYPISTPLPYGLVLRDRDGRIRRFFEKPTWPQVFSDWINAGIYVIEPALLDHIPDNGRPIFFEQEVFPPLAAAKAAIFGFPLESHTRRNYAHRVYWRDVGTPEDLRMANMDYLRGRFSQQMAEHCEPTGSINSQSLHSVLRSNHENRSVAGHGCEISPEAHVEACVIGSNCRIEPHARIRGSVIFDEARIGSGAQVENAIVMNGVGIEAQAEIRHHTVLAENAHIGAAAIIEANAVVRNDQKIAPGDTVTAKRVLPIGYLRRFVDGGSLLGSVAGGMGTDFMRWVGKAFALRQSKEPGRRPPGASGKLLLATEEEERFAVWARALAQGMLSVGSEVHLLEAVTLPVARWTLRKSPDLPSKEKEYRGGIYLGVDSLSGLLRLALMHSSGEDFTTAESCALERIDLTEAPQRAQSPPLAISKGSNVEAGNLRIIDAVRAREDYLRMVTNAISVTLGQELSGHFLPCPGSILDRPIPMRIGVIGGAAKQTVSKFFDMLGWPVKIDAFPPDISSDYHRSRPSIHSFEGKSRRSFQKTFVRSVAGEVGIGIWIGGLGERLQLALPGRGILPLGQSDAAIARLLLKHDPSMQLVGGWLFLDLMEQMASTGSAGKPSLLPTHRYDGCMLTPTFLNNSICSTATSGGESQGLGPKQNATKIVGFDGRGAVAISWPARIPPQSGLKATNAESGWRAAIAYPDALMTLAFLLVVLSKTPRPELEAMIPSATLGYRLMPCPDEAKAYLMRRLVEVYDQLDCAFSDGIRIEDKNRPPDHPLPDWVVVRPCAGKEALEIFWRENGSTPSLSVSVRRRLALWLRP